LIQLIVYPIFNERSGIHIQRSSGTCPSHTSSTGHGIFSELRDDSEWFKWNQRHRGRKKTKTTQAISKPKISTASSGVKKNKDFRVLELYTAY
jgi:hypothetical protein